MSEQDYPALYGAADAASNSAQAKQLRAFQAHAALLIFGAILSLASTVTTWFAVASAVVFLGSLTVYLYAQHRNFQAQWYQARALAESVKTATWRLMMRADPFTRGNHGENLDAFRELLNELLRENRGMGEHLAGEWSRQDQVTSRMRKVLDSPTDERKKFYLEHRIKNQRTWYAERANMNREASKKNLIWISVLYGVAVLLLILRVGYPEIDWLPIEVAAVAAGSLIGWKQLKRYDELASAYGLTAHEVGIIESRLDGIRSDAQLGAFVSDAENAFSREHTQWAARRDH